MGALITYSGVHFDPLVDDFSKINLTDIAHSLSHICRANGHCRIYYTVAQHCLACCREAEARGLSERIQLGCLLHDASEAYLSDIVRPLKELLGPYHELEDRMMRYIWTKYLGSMLTDDEYRTVFEIDDAMLEYEFHNIMAEDLFETYTCRVAGRIDICVRDCDEVAEEYISRVRELSLRILEGER